MQNLPLDAARRAFLEALFGQWQHDPVQAALRLRAYWDAVKPEIVEAAREYATHASALHHAGRAVEAHLPASAAASERSVALAAHAQSAQRFADVVALVRRCSGDPPAAPEASACARDVLEGRVAATAAFVTEAPSDEQWRRDADAVLRLFGGVPPELHAVLASTGMLAAALALPHEEVIAMFGWQAEAGSDSTLPERVRYERLLDRTVPDATALRLAAGHAGVLVEAGRGGDDAARVLLLLDELAAEIEVEQVRAAVQTLGTRVLSTELSDDVRHDLAVAVARAALHASQPEPAATALLGSLGAIRNRLEDEPEPLRSALALEVALALLHAGAGEQARSIASRIDMGTLVRTVGPPVDRWLAIVQEQLGPALLEPLQGR